MRRYQLQARRNSRAWFAATNYPIGWQTLLHTVSLWRSLRPKTELRAVEWKDSIR